MSSTIPKILSQSPPKNAMNLSHFSVIVAVDERDGIAKYGKIPWHNVEDQAFFRRMTTGEGKFPGVVIMGRITYDSLPKKSRPLPGRINFVITHDIKKGLEKYGTTERLFVVSSIVQALEISRALYPNSKVWIIGGKIIYEEVFRKYEYLCEALVVTRIPGNHGCDLFFPELPKIESKSYKVGSLTVELSTFTRVHQEFKYLLLLREVLEKGVVRPDRTGVGTKALFGKSLKFDISEEIPILTTRKINYESGIKELLFFISGETDTKILEKQGVKFWVGNTTADFLQKRGLKRTRAEEIKSLDYQEGDMGPGYGFQWRHWGAPYEGCQADYTGKGIDQLTGLIEGIKKDPYGRRHILSAWNVEQLPLMALPPCHKDCQFLIEGGKIHCVMNQRSADLVLGLPINILSYTILTYMIGYLTGYHPGTLTVNIADAHIYLNHIAGVIKQFQKTPLPWPSLSLAFPFDNRERMGTIDDFKIGDFVVSDYQSWPHIQYEMAV